MSVPGVVDDGGHAGPVQGQLADVGLVCEQQGRVTLPCLALVGVLTK